MEKKLHQRWSPLVYLQAMWTEKLREHLSVEKKPQPMKNICTPCIEKEELTHKEARERAHYSPFQYPF